MKMWCISKREREREENNGRGGGNTEMILSEFGCFNVVTLSLALRFVDKGSL